MYRKSRRSPAFNNVILFKISQDEKIAIPVGDPSAARLLLESMVEAAREKRPAFAPALSILWYTAKHERTFRSIGGGLSVGNCTLTSECFSWPIVKIDEKQFLRGMDVTESYRLDWPAPEVIPYDEEWCAEQHKRAGSTKEPLHEAPAEQRQSFLRFDIDDIVAP